VVFQYVLLALKAFPIFFILFGIQFLSLRTLHQLQKLSGSVSMFSDKVICLIPSFHAKAQYHTSDTELGKIRSVNLLLENAELQIFSIEFGILIEVNSLLENALFQISLIVVQLIVDGITTLGQQL
jgi:hypothetical protein